MAAKQQARKAADARQTRRTSQTGSTSRGGNTSQASSAAQADSATYRRRRGAISIMGRLIGLVAPLLPYMLLAIFFGVAGYLCAIFLTIVASYEVLVGVSALVPGVDVGALPAFEGFFAFFFAFVRDLWTLVSADAATWNYDELLPALVFAALVIMGVLRGVLHYIEQYCNHYIAFRLLAIIRHKVFAALRRLCPAKLEGRDKGNLISIITSDIELLEVFYAHTISPVAIALLICALMVWFISTLAWQAGVIALCAYLVLGVIVPICVGRAGSQPGLVFRDAFGDLNTFVLDSLRGIDETIQYGGGAERLHQMSARSQDLSAKQERLSRLEAHQRSFSNLIILLFSLGMLFAMLWLYNSGEASFAQLVVATVAMMGSFGPVLAISNLANNLNQTLACGDRVLNLLEEEPQVAENETGASVMFDGASAEHVDFSYGEEQILSDYSMEIEPGRVVGIHGVSGSGKSTLLKLLMRFWDVDSGAVRISGRDIRDLETSKLRDMESYVTQDTYLFHDTIANNIAVGKPGARRDEVVEAAQKASVHEFICTLPDGYDTQVGELGDTLSGGERQRIGVARAFLHDAPFLLLDEPTSNLDSLNEGIILKSLQEFRGKRTVVLVSHRSSTMNLADVVYEMDNGRIS